MFLSMADSSYVWSMVILSASSCWREERSGWRKVKVQIYKPSLRVIERDTGAEIGRIKIAHHFAQAGFISGTRDVYALKDYPKSIAYYRWNPLTGKTRLLFDTKEDFRLVNFLDQERVLGVSISRKSLQIINLNTKDVVVLETIGDAVYDFEYAFYDFEFHERVAVSPDRKWAACSVRDRNGSRILIVNLMNGKKEHEIKVNPPFIGRSLSYTPDGKKLVFVTRYEAEDDKPSKNYLNMYDATTYNLFEERLILTEEIIKPIHTLFSKREVYLTKIKYAGDRLAISPDGRYVAVGYDRYEETKLPRLWDPFLWAFQEGRVAIYEIKKRALVGTLNHPKSKEYYDYPILGSVLEGLVFSPDGKYLISSSDNVKVWQLP
jgi:WD40 repeat protein